MLKTVTQIIEENNIESAKIENDKSILIAVVIAVGISVAFFAMRSVRKNRVYLNKHEK